MNFLQPQSQDMPGGLLGGTTMKGFWLELAVTLGASVLVLAIICIMALLMLA